MKSEEFRLVKNTKKFILSLDDLLINFPKNEKVLKDKIYLTSYEILEKIFAANLITEREPIQKEIVSKLNMLDFYFEIAFKKKYISEKQCHRYCNELLAITKMTYGWIKNAKC